MGRAISHHTTIQLDAVGCLALDEALAVLLSAVRNQCTQLELYTRGVDQCNAKFMPQELSHPLSLSRSC